MRQFSLLTLVACGETEEPKIQEEVLDTADQTFDFDGDGYTSDEDCDDNPAQSFPMRKNL